MPFTVSHVAAVVPAYRPLARAHVFSAAVIGSMAPDFDLLLPGSFFRWQTHSLVALFSFCLPAGLAVYALTQVLIKPAVTEVLPDGPHLRVRTAHPRVDLGRLSTWLHAALAVLLGAITHLAWDAFTHENARGVRLFPFLSDYGPQLAGHSLRLYRWLQYGSSVLGLAVVAAALLLWLHHAPAPREPLVRRLTRGERLLWGGLYLAPPLVVLASSLAMAVAIGHGVLATGAALTRIAVLTMQACALSLLLVSGLLRVRLGR
jgi:hypothetical protein